MHISHTLSRGRVQRQKILGKNQLLHDQEFCLYFGNSLYLCRELATVKENTIMTLQNTFTLH